MRRGEVVAGEMTGIIDVQYKGIRQSRSSTTKQYFQSRSHQRETRCALI